MIINSNELERKLKEKWPNLKYIWLTDHEYWLPTLEDIKGIVKIQSVKNLKWRKKRMECEEFSLFLHANVKKDLVLRAEKIEKINKPIPIEFQSTWAFGEANGLNFQNGQPGPHKLNIVVAQDGIYLIEPQTNQIWKPRDIIKSNNMTDFIFYVSM